MDKVAVIGQGYVGLPLALEISLCGMMVFGVDTNSETVSRINRGLSPVEGVSDELISRQLESKTYSISNDFSLVSRCQVIVICVPTPLNLDSQPDTTYIQEAVKSIIPHISEGSLVILESTSYPGTTRELVFSTIQKETAIEKLSFYCAFSPERVDPLNTLWGIKNTPKLVSGIDLESSLRAYQFYEKFVDEVVMCPSPEVAEMSKLLENTYRMINISFINELMFLCNKVNIDIHDVIDAASTKPFGFQRFLSGLGAGGHCIPVDSKFLLNYAEKSSIELPMVKASLETNEILPLYHLNRIIEKFGSLRNKKILFLGISYKFGVSDVRESQAIKLMNLAKVAGAEVYWYDVNVKSLSGFNSYQSQTEYDLCVLNQDYSEYKEISGDIFNVYAII